MSGSDYGTPTDSRTGGPSSDMSSDMEVSVGLPVVDGRGKSDQPRLNSGSPDVKFILRQNKTKSLVNLERNSLRSHLLL